MVTMGKHVNHWGLVIAGVGFFLTRFTVTLALYESPVRFYLAGVVPLALGLGLAAFGVALAVADVDPAVVRTTALWCLVGAGTMLVLVVLTLLGSTPGLATVRSRTYLSNFLIGGSVGGTLTGLYAARTRRQRGELRRHAHRLAVLNRLLRHEVLNAVTVIKGYATTGDDLPEADAVVAEHSADIERTIEDVKHLTKSAATGGTGVVDLRARLDGSVATARDRYPAADVSVDAPAAPATLPVRADERLDQVFDHLLENAVVHATADEPTVEVSVEVGAGRVRVAVSDDGPGLPERQQRLLEAGEIEEFDDPDSGFGLNVVRLLVESYGGTVDTDVDRGTTVTVELPRARSDDAALRPTPAGVAGVRPSVPHLAVALVAAVLAGVPYGLVAEWSGGSVAFIGVYYGIRNPVVGWLTHEFHSVVFGFVYAGLVSLVPAARREGAGTYVAVGAGWGAVLWLLAAGVVSPIWLRLVGIPASIPSLSPALLASHLAWGVTLGLLTTLGYDHAAPWLSQVGERLGRSAAGS